LWSVVTFDDGTVACALDYWFVDGKCSWPNKNIINFKKAIKHKTCPNILDFDTTQVLLKNMSMYILNYLITLTWL